MGHLVIAGFNTWHIRTLVKKGINSVKAGWTVRLVPSGQKQIGFTEIEPVLAEARKDPCSHVLAVSEQGGEVRQKLAQSIKSYFRFRWVGAHHLQQILGSDFDLACQVIEPILREEEEWAQKVKPGAASHALMLPAAFFSYGRNFNIWQLSEAYGDPHAAENAARAAKRFTERYYVTLPPSGRFARTTQWVCEDGQVYDHRGMRHGEAPFPRSWKYSWKIESGFHFDVSSKDGRAFVARGFEAGNGEVGSRSVSPGKHVNLDGHGFFR